MNSPGISIEERISGKNKDEISNLMTEIEKERNTLEYNNDMIDDEISRIDREILRLREKKKELEDVTRKGRQLVREKRLDLKICERAYWKR